MDFLRQRLLLAADPLVAFLVTIVLAVLGFGFWSLIVGFVIGAWAGAFVAVLAAPYRLALRYDGATMRDYVGFSWPLVVAAASGLLIAQLSVFFGELTLGLAGAGAITLAATISTYTDKVDGIIGQTLYPAICAVRDRRSLLLETFIKANRLALMWAVPFGIGVALFGSDLVAFGIGEKWQSALVLIQVFGITAALNHIGFNWSAYYRALGNTRPMAVVTVIALGTFSVFALPLLLVDGLRGFAAGVALMAATALAARWYYIVKLFPDFPILVHMLRAIGPTLPAVLAVVAMRVVSEGGDRTLELALGELAVYVGVTAAATYLLERRLIREVLSYLRRSPRAQLGGA